MEALPPFPATKMVPSWLRVSTSTAAACSTDSASIPRMACAASRSQRAAASPAGAAAGFPGA